MTIHAPARTVIPTITIEGSGRATLMRRASFEENHDAERDDCDSFDQRPRAAERHPALRLASLIVRQLVQSFETKCLRNEIGKRPGTRRKMGNEG